MVCFQPPILLIGKVWLPVMHFCTLQSAYTIHCKVHNYTLQSAYTIHCKVHTLYTTKCITIHCKVHWRVGRRLGSFRFISAHHLIGSSIRVTIYRLSSVGMGGSVLSIFTQFLSNRFQHAVVDGCWRTLVNVLSGVP